MSFSLRAVNRLALLGLACSLPGAGIAQNVLPPNGATNLPPVGTEYPIAGSLIGDQVHARLAINPLGGLLVWQDTTTDGDGLGISAQRLDNTFSGTMGAFRINQISPGDQENPQVALLTSGGAAFVWQGGPQGNQKIFARFLSPSGTFATGDVLVNSYTNEQQVNPVVAALPDGNVMVAWSSYGQDGDMQGIFARRLSPAGAKLESAEFQVNQFTSFNQRSPSVSVLDNGNVVFSWISEQQRFAMTGVSSSIPFKTVGVSGSKQTVDVYARLYQAAGQPIGNEFLVNDATNSQVICANPVLCSSPSGGFVAAWSQMDLTQRANSWDVYARAFDSNGAPLGSSLRVNTFTAGDQFGPQITRAGNGLLLVWTSLAQDGDREGVFGQYFSSDVNGSLQTVGSEFQVNSTTASQQIQPALASDGASRYVAVWSSFIGSDASFDLFAQRFAVEQTLPQPVAPFVSALNSTQLSVTWPPLAGFSVDHYEVLMDSATSPAIVTNNQWTAANLAPASTHSFRLAFQLTDGGRSVLSAPGTGTTWGATRNDGLPFDWLIKFFGNDPSLWPAAKADNDGDGATTMDEFLAGTDPTDPNSVLSLKLLSTSQGRQLSWQTEPGFIYQVQVSPNVNAWTNLGAPRFAAGLTDSQPVDGTLGVAYYRILRLR
jgi:hypothetical protein